MANLVLTWVRNPETGFVTKASNKLILKVRISLFISWTSSEVRIPVDVITYSWYKTVDGQKETLTIWRQSKLMNLNMSGSVSVGLFLSECWREPDWYQEYGLLKLNDSVSVVIISTRPIFYYKIAYFALFPHSFLFLSLKYVRSWNHYATIFQLLNFSGVVFIKNYNAKSRNGGKWLEYKCKPNKWNSKLI